MDKKILNPFFDDSLEATNLPNKGLILHKSPVFELRNKMNQKIIYAKTEIFDKKFNWEIDKDTKPRIMLSKMNLRFLKETLASKIYEDFLKELKAREIGSLIPFNILNEVVPNEIDEREETVKRKISEIKKDIELNNVILKDNKEMEIIQIKDDKDNNCLINSDAEQLSQDIGYNLEQFKKIIENNRNYKDTPEKRWQYLSKRLGLRKIAKLLHAIRSVIVAMKAVYEENVTLKDKIKYYQILTDKDNEIFINFITQKRKSNVYILGEHYIEDGDDAEILFPSQNPELSESLTDIDNNIIEFLYKEKNDQNPKQTRKTLRYFYKEKNILIGNLTDEGKSGLINDNLRGNFLEEGRKRISWENEDEKRIINQSKVSILGQEIIQKENEDNIQAFHGQKEFIGIKDEQFLPNEKSLCPNMGNKWELPERVLPSDVNEWDKIEWNKYDGIKIFCNNSEPKLDNIRQGEYIGDCYFLSALGSLCNEENNNNNYLKDMISLIKTKGKLIIYYVRFNINGKRKYVLVDNFFPVMLTNGKNVLCFGSSFEKELWVSIFEKAWAKINGSYAQISYGGFCKEAFDILTDAYTESYQITGRNDERKQQLWKILVKANKNNYVICAGTRNFSLWEKFFSTGLIASHAYSIIGIFDLKEENLKLVKLRNPWGEKEYNGDWSDKSPKWNEKIKKKVNFKEVKDDGIFYMSYDDFIYYFKILEILKIKKDYKIIASCKIEKTEAYKCQIIEFEVEQNNTHVFINLYQKNPRIVRKKGDYYPQPVKSFIILAKKEKSKFKNDYNYTFIKTITESRVHSAIEAELNKGTYIVFCDVNYRFVYNDIYGYYLTFYSHQSNKLKIENITNKMNGVERSNLLSKVLYNYYESNKTKFDKDKTYNNIDVYKHKQYDELFPFIILLFKNQKGIDPQETYLFFSLNKKLNEKNACIYNDIDASEFDNFTFKQIKKNNTIILLMGYQLTDKFSFDYSLWNNKKKLENPIFNDGCEYNVKDNIQSYIIYAEKKKGIILGLQETKGIETKVGIQLEGLICINPEYDNCNNENEGIHISLKAGEKKILNLRLRPGCNKYGYTLNI